MKKLAIFGALALALASPVGAAVTLQIDANGHLSGATGVNVGGTLYDVTFADGSCTSLFSGCDANPDFNFNTAISAQAAAQALLDQVFLDSFLGAFDDFPQLTNGCESGVGCDFVIPYLANGSTFTSAWAQNNSALMEAGGNPDFAVSGQTGFANTTDLTQFPAHTFAIFSASVPEPSTWALMLLGFGGIGFAARHDRRRTLSQVGKI